MLTAKQAHQAVIERHKDSIIRNIESNIRSKLRRLRYEITNVDTEDVNILKKWLEKLGYKVSFKDEMTLGLTGPVEPQVMMVIEW